MGLVEKQMVEKGWWLCYNYWKY